MLTLSFVIKSRIGYIRNDVLCTKACGNIDKSPCELLVIFYKKYRMVAGLGCRGVLRAINVLVLLKYNKDNLVCNVVNVVNVSCLLQIFKILTANGKPQSNQWIIFQTPSF